MRQNSNWKRWNIINKGAYKAKTVKKRLESYNNFNIWDYCKMIHYGAEIILDIIPQLLSIIFWELTENSKGDKKKIGANTGPILKGKCYQAVY